eukprot:CAMPEP_0113690214 /NCGR_PEP_ID=MMETSP0038_2-20120614/17643_1 /TAXON_ID=2898 /ORGANISM="Cryptomonas paramecium" /LENGTH=83 /DNA_ID=CAMNT_0000611467 /DNA_START=3 /DNA_END=257 /DNA_ORIENTATION=+ /assembly_acc=CAM_ASM_000170
MNQGFNPSVRQLYKDCLRLLFHVASEHKSVNVPEVRKLVKQQFKANANVTDPEKLANLKNQALGALTNYVMYISQSKGGFKSS